MSFSVDLTRASTIIPGANVSRQDFSMQNATTLPINDSPAFLAIMKLLTASNPTAGLLSLSFKDKLRRKSPYSLVPPGEICGGAAFLSKPVEYLASTEAVINSTVLVWDRTTIRFLSTQYPRLVENALLIAYDYFVVYRSLHISATCQNARQRLAQVLGNLAHGMGQRSSEGIEAQYQE
ncbi:MAG: hypothetical protein WA869_08750 [Alloacidobacterium sp.]